MKKRILIVLLCTSLVFPAFVSSCSSGVTKEQYDKLNQEAASLREQKAEAGTYALFLDLLMYPVFENSNYQSRYNFQSNVEWSTALAAMATTINDDQLNTLMNKVSNNQAPMSDVLNYVLQHIENTLK